MAFRRVSAAEIQCRRQDEQTANIRL